MIARLKAGLVAVTMAAFVSGMCGLMVTATSAAASGPGLAISASTEPSSFQTQDVTSAIQGIYVKANEGTFTLTYEGATSGAIGHAASAVKVREELEAACKTVSGKQVCPLAGNIEVTGATDEGNLSRYLVTFAGSLAHDREVATLVPNATLLNGGTATVEQLVFGGEVEDRYVITVINTGSRVISHPVIIRDMVPKGVIVEGVGGVSQPALEGVTLQDLDSGEAEAESGSGFTCESEASPVKCTYERPMPPHDALRIVVRVAVKQGASGSEPNTATVEEEGTGGIVSTGPALTTLNGAQAKPGVADFGFAAYGVDGMLDAQAGDHPNSLLVNLDFNTMIDTRAIAGERHHPVKDARDVVVYLPVGLVGDPQATPTCGEATLAAEACPVASRIGTIVAYTDGVPRPATGVYNLVAEKGYPAVFGFTVSHLVNVMYATLVPSAEGYLLRVATPGVVRELEPTGALMTFFGDPAAEDRVGSPTVFYTNPTACDANPVNARIEANSWEEPRNWSSREATAYPPITGCDMLQFDPTLRVEPEAAQRQADTPAGYEVELKVPQAPNVWPDLATPDLKNATVALPAGVSLSPSTADGLLGCRPTGPEGINIPTGLGPHSEQLPPNQIGGEGEEIGPDGLSRSAPGRCPKASQIGEVEVKTPILPEPLKGHMYVAEPQCGGPGQKECTEASATNGELYGLYMEIAGSGVIVKLKGSVEVGGYGHHNDLAPGQLRTTFKENPQLPFEELKLNLSGGQRAPLANPQTCGTATTTSDLEPWSAPESGPNATPSWPFTVSGCASPMPFKPGFEAGTTLPLAGGFSPFTMTLMRKDGEQDLAGVTLSMPPGLAGTVSTVPLCPEPQAQAGTCSPASRIGTVHAAAGAGSEPLWLEGPVYLTGSYKGAPFGLSVVVPAVAGPFNLGDVVTRATVNVDPHTAQVTVVSDPFPQIRDGVPFRLKEVNVTVDRPGFMFNPTNCEQLHVTGTVSGDMPDGSAGATAPVSSPFAVAGCRNLPFKPAFSALTNATHTRFGGDSLHVVVKSAQGQANLREVRVELPKVLPSRLSTLNLACPEKTFAANPAACPAGSRVGIVAAQTPVLSVPLVGPAYFVSHGGAKFPELIFVLQGEGVTVQLNGETFISSKGITSSTFKTIPDVPVSRVDVVLPAGKDSVLTGEGDLCAHPLYMPTTITGQNGAVVKQKTRIAVAGCKPELIVLRHHAKGRTATIVVRTPSAGTLVATGSGIKRSAKRVGKAGTATIGVTLSSHDLRVLAKNPHQRVNAKVKLRFTRKHGAPLTAYVRLLMG